jgi:hypothetical protein
MTDNGGTVGVNEFIQYFDISVLPVNNPPSFVLNGSTIYISEETLLFTQNIAINISTGHAAGEEYGQELEQRLSFHLYRVSSVAGGSSPADTELFSAAPTVSSTGLFSVSLRPNVFGNLTYNLTLEDDGGGSSTSDPQLLTIIIIPVNYAPTFTFSPDPKTVRVYEISSEGPYQTPGPNLNVTNISGSTWQQAFAKVASNISPGPPSEDYQRPMLSFKLVPRRYRVPSFVDWNSTNVESLFEAGHANQLFVAGTNVTIDASSGNLLFVLQPERSGEVEFDVTLSDGEMFNSTSEALLLTLKVLPVNQAPSFTLSSQSIALEEDETVFLTNFVENVHLGGWREENQEVTMFLTSPEGVPSYVGAFSFNCSKDVPLSCNVTYTPGAHVFGNVTLVIEMQDNGPMEGGGLNSFNQTFNVTITPLNDPPLFTLASSTVVVREGSACITDTPEVGEWSSFVEAHCNDSVALTHDRMGYARDVSAGLYEDGPPVPCLLEQCESQTATFTVTVLDAVATELLFEEVPTILWPSGRILFKLKPFVSGKASFNVSLTDANATSPPGDTKTSEQQTFTIDVMNVNSKPSFIHLFTEVRVFEDSGPYSRLFATNITTDGGLLNTEPGQTLKFKIEPDRPDLFYSLPQVDEAGIMTFTPAQDAFGTCRMVVTLVDDGGRVNGGKDTSEEVELTIVLLKVNDRPSFELSPALLDFRIQGLSEPALRIRESAGANSFPNFAIDIVPGPENEAGVCAKKVPDDTCELQSVKFEVIDISNPLLFFWLPAISPSGTLTFYCQPNVTGSTTVTVMLVDSGDINTTETSSFRGLELSVTHTFGIHVEPINTAPDFRLPLDVSCQTAALLVPGRCSCDTSFSACALSANDKNAKVTVLEDAGRLEIQGFAGELTTMSGALPTSAAYFLPGASPAFAKLESDALAKAPSMEYSVDYALSADGKYLFSAEFETDTVAAFDVGTNSRLTLTDRRGEGEKRLRFDTVENGKPLAVARGACSIEPFEADGQLYLAVARGCKPLDEEAGACAKNILSLFSPTI